MIFILVVKVNYFYYVLFFENVTEVLWKKWDVITHAVINEKQVLCCFLANLETFLFLSSEWATFPCFMVFLSMMAGIMIV